VVSPLTTWLKPIAKIGEAAGALHEAGGPTPAAGPGPRSIVGLLRAPRAALGVRAALVAVGGRA
jgi:hypothetical protein